MERRNRRIAAKGRGDGRYGRMLFLLIWMPRGSRYMLVGAQDWRIRTRRRLYYLFNDIVRFSRVMFGAQRNMMWMFKMY